MELLKKHIRTVPDFPKAGILFRDITPLLESPEAFGRTIEIFAERYRDEKLDRIVAIDARGFLFGAALGLKLGVGLALVRKPGKLPHDTARREYSLEYGKDAVEMHKDAVAPGQRCLIVDDLLATGGTAAAAVELVAEQGGHVVECAFVIELTGLGGRERLAGAPSFALMDYPA